MGSTHGFFTSSIWGTSLLCLDLGLWRVSACFGVEHLMNGVFGFKALRKSDIVVQIHNVVQRENLENE